MASPGNLNQPGGGPFDVHKFFKPTTAPSPGPNPISPTTSGSNTQNPNLISGPFPPPSASYPPPTGGAPGGPYSFSPQTSPFHHPHPPPQFHHHHLPQFSNSGNPANPPLPLQPDPSSQFTTNLHQQRSMSFPAPPLQPPLSSPPHHQFQNPQNPSNSSGNTSQNPGARLMALLSAPPSTLEISQQQPVVSMAPMQPTTSGGSDFSTQQNLPLMTSGPNMGFPHPGPMRMPSSKLPKGRSIW